jgi:type IV pilus assembly protein PilC
MTVAIGIVLFIMLFIVPKFKEIFAEFGVTMPAITSFLINSSSWLAGTMPGQSFPGAIIIIGLPILLFVAWKVARRAGPGRAFTDRMLLMVPLIGGLIRKTVIAKFTRTLGTLINAGVPILEAIAITRDTSGNAVYEKALNKVHDSIREGETFAQPLRESKVCDPIVVNMIEVGEETGDMDSMLMKVADNYDEEVDVAVGSLVKLIEPLLVLFLGVVVGGIVIAMFLPLISIIEKLQSGGV